MSQSSSYRSIDREEIQVRVKFWVVLGWSGGADQGCPHWIGTIRLYKFSKAHLDWVVLKMGHRQAGQTTQTEGSELAWTSGKVGPWLRSGQVTEFNNPAASIKIKRWISKELSLESAAQSKTLIACSHESSDLYKWLFTKTSIHLCGSGCEVWKHKSWLIFND